MRELAKCNSCDWANNRFALLTARSETIQCGRAGEGKQITREGERAKPLNRIIRVSAVLFAIFGTLSRISGDQGWILITITNYQN